MLKIILILFLLASCATDSSYEDSKTIESMQQKDKKLSCKEILLEMNEAEFYKKIATRSRGPKLKNVLMPLGYISTYMDSEDAIDASEARIGYLRRIYEIMDCKKRN